MKGQVDRLERHWWNLRVEDEEISSRMTNLVSDTLTGSRNGDSSFEKSMMEILSNVSFASAPMRMGQRSWKPPELWYTLLESRSLASRMVTHGLLELALVMYQ